MGKKKGARKRIGTKRIGTKRIGTKRIGTKRIGTKRIGTKRMRRTSMKKGDKRKLGRRSSRKSSRRSKRRSSKRTKSSLRRARRSMGGATNIKKRIREKYNIDPSDPEVSWADIKSLPDDQRLDLIDHIKDKVKINEIGDQELEEALFDLLKEEETLRGNKAAEGETAAAERAAQKAKRAEEAAAKEAAETEAKNQEEAERAAAAADAARKKKEEEEEEELEREVAKVETDKPLGLTWKEWAEKYTPVRSDTDESGKNLYKKDPSTGQYISVPKEIRDYAPDLSFVFQLKDEYLSKVGFGGVPVNASRETKEAKATSIAKAREHLDLIGLGVGHTDVNVPKHD